MLTEVLGIWLRRRWINLSGDQADLKSEYLTLKDHGAA